MKVCLINSLYGAESRSCPLGIGYLASYLRENNHSVKIIDRVPFYYKNNLDLDICDNLTKKEILKFRPDIVGFTCMTSQIPDLIHISKKLKKMPELNKSLFVAGGSHIITEPEWTLKYIPTIDVSVFGEGETVMLSLANEEKLEVMKGIAYKKNNKIIKNSNFLPQLELDQLPFPARDLMDMEFYCQPSNLTVPGIYARALTIITSRGCPGKCNFCASKVIEPMIRWHSVEYVIKEVEKIINDYPKVKVISFVDIMFLGNKKRGAQICEEFIKRGINKKVKWAVSIRADVVDKEILSLMKKAGCFYINYGFESGSQKMLDEMNKMTKVSDNFKAARLTKEIGILADSAMIVGLPNETEEDFAKTIEFIKKTQLFCSSLNILIALPGTEFYKRFISEGRLKYDANIWQKTADINSRNFKDRIYSNIAPERFLELYKIANIEIVRPLNAKNYIKYNWRSDPIGSFKEFVVLFLCIVYKTKFGKFLFNIFKKQKYRLRY